MQILKLPRMFPLPFMTNQRKKTENLQVREKAQEPDHAPQQKSSDIAQGQEEDFRVQPANDAEDFSSPIPDKGIVWTTPEEQTIESPLQYKGSADTGLVYSDPSTGPNDLITIMDASRSDEDKADNANSETCPPNSSPVPEIEIVPTTPEVEQTIKTPIEGEP